MTIKCKNRQLFYGTLKQLRRKKEHNPINIKDKENNIITDENEIMEAKLYLKKAIRFLVHNKNRYFLRVFFLEKNNYDKGFKFEFIKKV